MRDSQADLLAAVGLCARCRFARRQAGARGTSYWRCLRADRDPSYRRYPPLPVRTCPGYEVAGPAREPEPSGRC